MEFINLTVISEYQIGGGMKTLLKEINLLKKSHVKKIIDSRQAPSVASKFRMKLAVAFVH